MSETEQGALVEPSRRISLIWLVPLVAVILGVWLAVQAYRQTGPTITIRFENGEGIERDATLVKARNVEIGVVTDLKLSDDLQGVMVTAELTPEARRLLRDDTQFWVVRPRVRGVNVSGLGTLLSGAYIEASTSDGALSNKRAFEGLEQAPVTPAGTPGLRLQLTSSSSGDLAVGSPVLYRGYAVGSVEQALLQTDTKQVLYSIFIDAPYNQLVTSNTRFWNASGISAELSSEGVKLSVGSLQSALAGGVAFDLPDGMVDGEPVADSTMFSLYADEASIQQDPHRYHVDYVALFSQSLRGLNPGAPVSYRGIQIGSVQRVMAPQMDGDFSTDHSGTPIPVILRLEPARMGLPDRAGAVAEAKSAVARNVAEGMRAVLETGNLLTGSLYVGLEFFPDLPSAQVEELDGYPRLPTQGSGLEHMQQLITRLLYNLNELPLNETVESLRGAVDRLEQVLLSAQGILDDESTRELTATLQQSLVEATAALQSFKPEAPLQKDLQRTLSDFKGAMQSLDRLADRLEANPNALVFPSRTSDDPVPEAPGARSE